MTTKNWHVAVIDDFNACFVSESKGDLQTQVSEWLVGNSVAVPTDAEWAMTFGEDRYDVDLTTPADGWISYYTTESRLQG